MRITKTKNTIRDVLWGSLSKLLMILFPFVIRTALIKIFGEQYLGISNLFSSILQMLSLSELGMASAIVYCMYRPIAQDDTPAIRAYLNFFKIVYRIIGIFILVVGLCLIPFLPNLIKGSYPDDVNLVVVYLAYLANTVISYLLFAYKSSILTGYQRNDINSRVLLTVNTGLYLLQIIVLVLTKNYYFYIYLLPISTIVINLYRNYWVKKLFPDLYPSGNLSKEQIKEIWKKVLALMGNKLSIVLLGGVDNIVISSFLGLSAVAIFGNYYYICTSITSIISVFYFSLTSGIGNAMNTDTVDKNYHHFTVLNLINYWIVGFCSICLICLYQPFMQLWLGKDMMYSFDTVILFAVYFFMLNIKKIVVSYKDAGGMWIQDIARPYVEGVVNITVNIILVQIIGINGILIASIGAMGLISLPWETWVVFKTYFKKDMREFMLTMLKSGIAVVFSACICIFLCSTIKLPLLAKLIVNGLICVVVGNGCLWLCFRFRKEYADVVSYVKRIIKKG